MCILLRYVFCDVVVQVVVAFDIGRGGVSLSYMGRGVTRCAAICLAHLAQLMDQQLNSQVSYVH